MCAATALLWPQPGEAAAPTLNGLYRAFPAVAQYGAAVGQAYVFSSRGDVYNGWTGTQSVDKFDFARARQKHPAKTGKYRVTGDKITFFWSNNTSETAAWSQRRDAKGRTTLSIGPNYAYKVVPGNARLVGTFTPNTYQGGFAESPNAIVDRISFTRDGRFTITDDNARQTSGRYAISGATLTLITTKNQKKTHSLHVFAERAQPLSAILIDGRPFSAQK